MKETTREATRITAEPPAPIRVRLLKDGVSIGTVVHKAGDVAEVPVPRALAMFRHQEAVYADPARETPSWQDGRLVEVGSLPASDPLRMARQIAELQSGLVELRQAVEALTAPASRPKSK